LTVKIKAHPLQQVLELACAAQRTNKAYVKMLEAVYSDTGTLVYYRHTNRSMMQVALGEWNELTTGDPLLKPPLITTNMEDRELATDIQHYYRRLAFAAIQGDDEFKTELNLLLTSGEVPINKIGFIACLPSLYVRDYAKHQMEKRIAYIDSEHLGVIGNQLMDKDCEIMSTMRSKNFDAWNIDAIIDNKMVSWMSKIELRVGPCVVIKANVKDLSLHWKYNIPVTRLNYVKAFQ